MDTKERMVIDGGMDGGGVEEGVGNTNGINLR